MTHVSRLDLVRPDDWHLHLRDGAMLAAVLPFTSAVFGRAIVMPNLVPPARTAAEVAAYRARIVSAVPAGHVFEPLMTCYLTDGTDPADLRAGYAAGAFVAAGETSPGGSLRCQSVGMPSAWERG